jgi:glucose/arabinose dehydrogenase
MHIIRRFAGAATAALLSGCVAVPPAPVVAPAAPAPAPAAQCSYGPFAADTYFPAPAFPGQTKAPAAKPSPGFTVETVTDKLSHPWSLAFLPNGHLLVTERGGQMRIIATDGTVAPPIAGVPPVTIVGAEGLHDVALDPHFADNRLIYFTYYAPLDGSQGGPVDPQKYTAWSRLPPAEREAQRLAVERTARARLSEDESKLENLKVLFDGANRRLVFDAKGALFIGAATVAWDTPQQLTSPYGKEIRILPNGSVPKDNPWANKTGVQAKLFAYGFKDPEGAAMNPATGELWMTDHGPRGGDEINVIRAGKNYGFPEISYGREYSGEPMLGKGGTQAPGMQQPLYYWNPSPALSGMMFYTGDLFPAWKGDLFVGAMAGKHLIRLTLDGEKITGEEALLVDRCERIRDVRQAPDGSVYVLTDEDKGSVLRLVPKK